MTRLRDLKGAVFGTLTVLKRKGSDGAGRALWVCKCDCGGHIIARSQYLMNGTTWHCTLCTPDKMLRWNIGEVPDDTE